MKLITWNCQGAFRKKYPAIARLQPDLAVIQECEQLERIRWAEDIPSPASRLWFGLKPTRGLGIFSWTGLELSPLENTDPSINYCLPVRVSGAAHFHLLAIWAMAHRDSRLSYIAQVNFGLIAYQAFIQEADTVLMGDFNSNQRSDKIQKLGYHGLVVRSLADLEIVSAYHFFTGEKHGKETAFTFYHGRKQSRPFHLDYIFIPRRWIRRVKRVTVGRPEDWLALSDHCPVMVELL